MSRNVQLVLLCEDKQHEVFARRFLEKAGWSTRRLRIVLSPKGRGSAEQFVRERYPIELEAYRNIRNQISGGLIVIIDGDNQGVEERKKQLDDFCRSAGISPRQSSDSVAIIVPTWNIETWLAYLDGTDVDETKKDYARLERLRDCQNHVNVLHEMCKMNSLRQPAPESLQKACSEFSAKMPQV